jgi:curved DNA-binding protein CbpA
MAEERDLYKVLQVDPGADAEVIGAAFRALARRLHPDRDAGGTSKGRMSELNRAYAVLRDAEKRMAYDAERARRPTVREPAPSGATGISPTNAGGAASDGHDREDGETRLDFGRYAGMTLRDIARKDSDYLDWLSRHSSGIRFRREIAEIVKESGAPTEEPPGAR